MDVLKFIVGLLILGAIIFGYLMIWNAINSHCSDKYSYEPLSLGPVILCAIAAVASVIGASMWLTPAGAPVPNFGWNDAFLHSQACNGFVISILGALLEIGLFIFLWVKTSFLSTISAMIMLMIASATVVFVVIAVIALIFASASNSRRKVYVVEE